MKKARLLFLLPLLFVPFAASAEDKELDVGLKDGYKATDALGDIPLNNPSSVTFSPDGELTVVDSANGRVLVSKDGVTTTYLSGFDTEYWKVDPETGKKRYKLGPLSALWIGNTLAVTDGGKKDGNETILFYNRPRSTIYNHAYRDADASTNAVTNTTGDDSDNGEGNLTGMSLSKDGKTAYVCGQGTDLKTWLLSCNISEKALGVLVSADEHGIETNSPMQSLVVAENRVLVIYSGAGGKDDGMAALWDVKAQKLIQEWKLPGIKDPMGIAPVPGKDNTYAVVDNNWALTEVNRGKLAIVKLGENKKAEIEVLTDDLLGPTHCAFGPDKKLYVTLLGEKFDANMGQVIAIDGLCD